MRTDGRKKRELAARPTFSPFSNSPTSIPGKSARASSEWPTSSKASVASLPEASMVNSCVVGCKIDTHQLQKG